MPYMLISWFDEILAQMLCGRAPDDSCTYMGRGDLKALK